jgi:hypothetical protein
MVDSHKSPLELNDYFEYKMKDGFAGAFKFKRSDGVTARLAHEPKFTKTTKDIRSYVINQEPDIVLEITIPASNKHSKDKQFIWLFDAKYRIKQDLRSFDSGEDNINNQDHVPDDAINQMHRYRDALIRMGENNNNKKSRPVFGAFALYPGFFDQQEGKNPYSDNIKEVGIGAFALLPSQDGVCGHKWLLDFLKSQIDSINSDKLVERLYMQDPSRIPHHGMRQVLYDYLTMTIALGAKSGREKSYFERFKRGTAQWYHTPQETFTEKFAKHMLDEISYLAIAITSDSNSSYKQVDKVWRVKNVKLLPRDEITEAQSGKSSTSNKPFYLFELGKPLTLHTPI